MVVCPQCGAENPDGSTFCSLCLARFGAVPGDPRETAAREPATPRPGVGEYVSPGDYRALTREMREDARGYRGDAFRDAAMSHPGAVAGVALPSWAQNRSRTDIVLLVLKYSFLAYILLFMANFLIGLFIFGAAFGGSESGFTFGVGMLYLADAVILILSGYLTSRQAMHAGKGWLYGLSCVAAVVFFWQPLISLIIVLLISGEFFVPIFNLAGILIALFLYLPLGALGGWMAEKRYMG